MKSQDYRLFPQQQVVQSTTQRSEKLFSPQQNWRQFATHQRSVESFQPPQPVTFFNQQPILQSPPAIIQQAPVKTFLPPQQFVQILPQQIPQQVFVQQPAFSQTQQAHHQIREQNLDNRQTIQKQQQQQQAQQLAQQKAQEEQFQEQQSQSIKNINAYRQQLIQENYKEVKQNENLKQLEEKIHNEILSQSKRHNPALSQTQVQAQTQSHYILPQQVQIQQQQPQSTKSFLQSIRIHDNQTDLHLHKSKKANFFENHQAAQQQNQQYTQSQIQYVQSPYVSYVSPAPQLFTSQTKVLAPTVSTPVFTTIQQQPSATALVTSQVRLFQPQLAPVPVQSSTTIIPTNPLLFNSVISNPVNPVSTYSKVITSPSKIITKPVLTKSFITSPQTQQTVLPLVMCNSQTKLTPYIPPQVLQSPKNQAQFQHEFSFQNGYRHSNTERENGLQSNFIKSIDGGFTTERVTRASKPQTVSVAAAPPQNNVDSHQQQVRNIISQSKYLLQNDILPQQQQLNQEYQGLKVYEKLGLQNRIDQDNFNQEFQKRRQEFNQRLQQCSTVHKADEVNEYREQYPANPQANLYLVQQQQQQQQPPQQQQQQQKVVTTITTTTNVQVPIKTSQIAVSQNVSMLNNPQNESTTSNYVLAQSIDPSHSQTLKQPILHQYEQQLIIQQQSTSSYPSTSRSPLQQVSGQTEKLTFNKPAVEQQQPQEEPQNEQIKRANHPQHEQEDDEVNQESPEPSISNQIIQQQTVAATTVAAAEGNSNGVHQVISGDDVYSKQHQEFKMKFQKTKDQFYQEKSNQLSERSRQQLQQQQEQEQQELLQAHQQFLAARGTANQQLLETIVNTQQQQQQQQQQQTQQQQQVGSTSQTITTTTTTTTSTVNGTVVAQEKVSKKESVHKEAVQQVQEEEEEDSHHEQAQIHQNNEQHEQENHEIHEQIQVDKHVEEHQVQENNIDLAQAQQQFLQNRGQINQLFLQSLEKQYQNQFDNNEEDEHQQQEEQEDREEGDDVDHQQLLAEEQEEQGEYQEQLNEGEEEVDEDQQQYYEGEMNQFPADLLPPENFESEEEYHQYLEMYKQMHFQQLNYIQSQGQAGEDQAYYENQQQANGYNQLRGEDLVNFEEFQAHQNQQQHQFENQDDMNREFEQQHQYQVNQNIQMQQQQQLILNSEHQQQYQLTQEQYQQLLHQQQLQQLYEQQQHLTISQYQQQTGSPSNYDDEERLVMMRQQQLIAEKRQRDEEYKKQIEQFEQDEMLRLSSHSVGKKNSSEENN